MPPTLNLCANYGDSRAHDCSKNCEIEMRCNPPPRKSMAGYKIVYIFSHQLEELTRRKKDREELGVNLYNSQQELARLQMLLEKEHDKYNENHNLRAKAEGKLNSIKEIHSKNTNLLVEQRKKGKK